MQQLFDSRPTEIVFPTAYDAVLERIHHIDPVRYGKTRNFINGAVTYLSPYISRGVISLLQVQEAVLAKGYKKYQIEKFLQELAWREYFQRVWQAKGSAIEQDLKNQQPDFIHQQMIEAVANAQTGINGIDQQIEALYNTGYMHNHGRMYVASLVCNIGRAGWQQPARWLYHHLLDGDLASNHCSWQWVAGAFSSKKYYCNQENINRYTATTQQKTFLDVPYEAFADMEVPVVLQATTSLTLQTNLPETPVPVIDTTLPTLIYNSYNLDPNWRSGEQANRVLLLEPSHFEKYPVSQKVIDFIVALAANINNIQIFVGEIDELVKLYNGSGLSTQQVIIAKEHPAFTHYPGVKDNRDWLYTQVSGYHSSFFNYWKKCDKSKKV